MFNNVIKIVLFNAFLSSLTKDKGITIKKSNNDILDLKLGENLNSILFILSKFLQNVKYIIIIIEIKIYIFQYK